VNIEKIFIVGLPRSGTTWVMWLLAQHPEVVALQQSGMFLPLKRLEEWWAHDHRFTHRAGRAQDSGTYATAGSTTVITPHDFHQQARAMMSVVYERLAARTPGARFVVDQTPEHMEFAPLIRAVFPDAWFLHIVRDPRAVYSSMRQALHSWADPSGFPHTPIHIAHGWNRFVQLGRQIGTTCERYLEVRYEDLTARGEQELGRIHAWLGLESDPASRRAALAACEIDKLRSNTSMPKGFFRRGTADGWEGELSRSELRTIEYLTRDEMDKHGYATRHPRAAVKPLRVALYELAQTVVTAPARRALFPGTRARSVRLGRTLQLMRDFKLVRY
jgi:hypothetical protein